MSRQTVGPTSEVSARFRDALTSRSRLALHGIRTTPGRIHGSFSRVARLFVLLIVILLALSSTTFLERPSQIALLKGFLVFVLALIPGWLYLQFIDSKATRLYDEYVLNLFRLKIDSVENLPKPPPGSSYWGVWIDAMDAQGDRVDISENVYLKKFESVYGETAIPAERHVIEDTQVARHKAKHKPVGIAETIKTEKFSPVILTTALLALGWVAFVGPELYRDLPLFRPGEFSGLPAVPYEPLRLGFLGSYIFILQSFVRRYYASDLKTRAFVGALLRVVLVAGLVIVIHPIWDYNNWPTELEAVFAFTVGYFPDFALRLIKTKVLGITDMFRRKKDDDEERFPLKELDGLNLWYEARLVEEGVENMQNLATTSIVDLMISTRTPVTRLVDWIDQAFLYLRVTKPGDRTKLRKAGIRTATDLIRIVECFQPGKSDYYKGIARLLNDRDGHDDGGPSAIEGLKCALDGEVNLVHVRHFKAHEWLEAPAACATAKRTA